MQHEIYLDHAATTPVDPAVVDEMLPWLVDASCCGNPSSIHSYGRRARAAIDLARDRVAALIGSDYSEIVFTSCGSEADNLAVFGVMRAARNSGRNHLVISSIEHHAVLNAAHALTDEGFEVTIIPVSTAGIICLDALQDAVSDRTALVSIMHANNEIGTIQPIQEAAQIAHACGALFHTDAVQSAPVLPIDVNLIPCDLLTLSAHKLYGPKGAGGLYVRTGLKMLPTLFGGAQERERRAGTENVPGCVGFGAAAMISAGRRDADAAHLRGLTVPFMESLRELLPDIIVNGAPDARLPGTVNFSVPGVEGATLLMNLDRAGVYASSGAACSSGSIEPSHVLKAIGLVSSEASRGVRLSAGRSTAREDMQYALEQIVSITRRLQSRERI